MEILRLLQRAASFEDAAFKSSGMVIVIMIYGAINLVHNNFLAQQKNFAANGQQSTEENFYVHFRARIFVP